MAETKKRKRAHQGTAKKKTSHDKTAGIKKYEKVRVQIRRFYLRAPKREDRSFTGRAGTKKGGGPSQNPARTSFLLKPCSLKKGCSSRMRQRLGGHGGVPAILKLNSRKGEDIGAEKGKRHCLCGGAKGKVASGVYYDLGEMGPRSRHGRSKMKLTSNSKTRNCAGEGKPAGSTTQTN